VVYHSGFASDFEQLGDYQILKKGAIQNTSLEN
jgi:hypothetical protein